MKTLFHSVFTVFTCMIISYSVNYILMQSPKVWNSVFLRRVSLIVPQCGTVLLHSRPILYYTVQNTVFKQSHTGLHRVLQFFFALTPTIHFTVWDSMFTQSKHSMAQFFPPYRVPRCVKQCGTVFTHVISHKLHSMEECLRIVPHCVT